MPTDIALLTLSEAADLTRYSVHTLRKWTYAKLSGWPQPKRTGPQGEWRWLRSDIERWVARQPQQSIRTTQLPEARP